MTRRTKYARLSVNLPRRLLQELKEIAEEEELTLTEVLRRLIETQKFLRKEVKRGNKVLIEDKEYQKLVEQLKDGI